MVCAFLRNIRRTARRIDRSDEKEEDVHAGRLLKKRREQNVFRKSAGSYRLRFEYKTVGLK